MERKKRRVPKQFQTPVQENKPTVAYQDEFQSSVNRKVENFGDKFTGKGKNILYGLGALAVLAALVLIFFAWNRRSNAEAQTALGKAIETSQATVSASPAPAGFTGKMFKTENERAAAAVAEFQLVAAKYGGAVRDKARYFAAVNRLSVDRAAAINDLNELANVNGEVGTLSKYALAQTAAEDGKLDEAAAGYQALIALDNPILSKDTLNFELAKIYEKQNKTAEAAELYFNIAKPASEAKDINDKPVPMTQTATEAKKRLEELNPEKAKEIVEPPPTMPQMNNLPIELQQQLQRQQQQQQQ